MWINGQNDLYNNFILFKIIKSVDSQKRNSIKNKLTFFDVVATKPVDIVFDQIIDKINRLIGHM